MTINMEQLEQELQQSIRDKEALKRQLIERDGLKCQFPGCNLPFDPNPNDRHSISIDHIYPQVRARADGWTEEEIWDLSNLQLMGRNCNAKKSDLLYDDDGNLPINERIKSVKLPRPEECVYCNNGRALYPGQTCDICGSLPQPINWPATLQKRPKDCDHSTFFCWLCTIDTPELRVPAIQRIAFG